MSLFRLIKKLKIIDQYTYFPSVRLKLIKLLFAFIVEIYFIKIHIDTIYILNIFNLLLTITFDNTVVN